MQEKLTGHEKHKLKFCLIKNQKRILNLLQCHSNSMRNGHLTQKLKISSTTKCFKMENIWQCSCYFRDSNINIHDLC